MPDTKKMLQFKMGEYGNLPATKAPGTIYVTTDEKAMYVDIDASTRIRIGQTITIPTLSAFKTYLASKVPPYDGEDAFYYIVDANALLKFKSNSSETTINGEKITGTWTQVNSTADITAALSTLTNRVKDVEDNLNTLGQTVGTLSSDLGNLTTEVGGKASQADLNGVSGRVGTLESTITTKADKTTVEGLTNTVTTIAGDYLKTADKTALQNSISEAKDAADEADRKAVATQGEVDALETEVGKVKTTANKAAADLLTLSGTVETISTDVNTIKEDYLKSSDKEALSESIKATDDKAVQAQKEVDALETVVSNLTSSVSTTYETKTDATTKLSTAKTYAEGQASAALTSAKSYTNEVKSDLEGKIGAKADTSAVNNQINGITQAIGGKTDKTEGTVYGYINVKDAATLEAAKKYTDDTLKTADAMTFKGVLGTGTGMIALPTDETTVNAGDTYKVGTAGTYAGNECKVGDLLIAKVDGQSSYYHVTSGYEDDYNSRLNVVEETETVNDETRKKAKITLLNGVGGDTGSVTFKSDNLDIVSTISTDAATKQSTATVSIEMTWGTF